MIRKLAQGNKNLKKNKRIKEILKIIGDRFLIYLIIKSFLKQVIEVILIRVLLLTMLVRNKLSIQLLKNLEI